MCAGQAVQLQRTPRNQIHAPRTALLDARADDTIVAQCDATARCMTAATASMPSAASVYIALSKNVLFHPRSAPPVHRHLAPRWTCRNQRPITTGKA
eukprot:362938-Chlamydomonas_euryale.AAC.4